MFQYDSESYQFALPECLRWEGSPPRVDDSRKEGQDIHRLGNADFDFFATHGPPPWTWAEMHRFEFFLLGRPHRQ